MIVPDLAHVLSSSEVFCFQGCQISVSQLQLIKSCWNLLQQYIVATPHGSKLGRKWAVEVAQHSHS